MTIKATQLKEQIRLIDNAIKEVVIWRMYVNLSIIYS